MSELMYVVHGEAELLRAAGYEAEIGFWSGHGHLLSPPLARDGGFVLELRAADLSRLHDHHFGGNALPGVLARADPGEDAA